MELVMQIQVILGEQFYVSGGDTSVNMISFTGNATGKYFNGRVIGTGVDTQKMVRNHSMSLSARYMLEGTDYKNNRCRVFIENNGPDMEHCVPTLITDSEVLRELQRANLRAKVTPNNGGVLVSIYRD